MKTTMVMALVLLLGIGQANAKAGRPDKDRAANKEAFNELRTSMHSWLEKSVFPTLSEWKRTYDASLSSQDLTELNKLRAEAKASRENMGKEMRSAMTKNHEDHSERHDAIKGMREQHRESMESIMERLKPIADHSKDKLRSIFDSGEPKIEAWKNEAQALMKAWHDKYPDLKSGRLDHHRMKGLPLGIGDGGKRSATRFMLWDGTIPSRDESSLLFPSNGTTGLNDASRDGGMPLHITPLPASSAVTVRQQGLQDGPATIEIFDMNGVLVRSVPTTVSNGILEQHISTDGIPAGTYMTSINSPSGRRTSQMVIAR